MYNILYSSQTKES